MLVRGDKLLEDLVGIPAQFAGEVSQQSLEDWSPNSKKLEALILIAVSDAEVELQIEGELV